MINDTIKILSDYTKLFVNGSGTKEDPYTLSKFGCLIVVFSTLSCLKYNFNRKGVKNENKNN